MNKNDFDKFCGAWGATCEIYNITPTDAAMTLAFKVLARYEIGEVLLALTEHVTTSQFAPKPADIIGKLVKSDGRPEVDEAWSIAVDSFDEYKTVVMNDEIAGSLEHARGIYNDGDKVGARMSFKASYEKRIAKARHNGDPVKWWPSMGFDEQGRRAVLEKAVNDGLLTSSHVNKLLPSPITESGQKVIGEALKELEALKLAKQSLGR